MPKLDFMDAFNLKRIDLHEVEGLNQGGCGIAAYGLQLWAKKFYPEQRVEVVFCFTDDAVENDYHNIRSGRNGSCNHALVRVNGVHYDSDRTYPEEFCINWELPVKMTMSETTLRRSLNERYHWSPRFDRDQGIPEIEEILEIDLNLNA